MGCGGDGAGVCVEACSERWCHPPLAQAQTPELVAAGRPEGGRQLSPPRHRPSLARRPTATAAASSARSSSSSAAGEAPPRHASSTAQEVATLAAELGGAAVVRALATARSVAPTALLEDGTPQRGEITATFGPAGCDELWGLRLRQRRGGITAVLVSVAEGSVAAGGAPWLRHGLQLIGVDGWHPSAHGGSLLRALEAAAAAVGRRAREGRWRGGDSCRLLTLRFRDPRWLCEHLAREGEAHRQRRADANLFSACN